MSKQRIVKDEIWDDEWFYDLTPNEKLVWIFLLTNSRANIAGIYKMGLHWMSPLIGLDKPTTEKILQRFVKDGKLLWEDNWIGLVNFHRHLPYRNQNVVKGIKRLYEENHEQTKALKGFERLWVTLLNSTLLNLTDIAADAALFEVKKEEKSTTPFSLAEEIKKLEDSPRRDLNVIAMYLEHRKPDLQSKEQYTIALRRHLRAAKALASFSDQQIARALNHAKKEYPGIYTLETLTKILTK